MTLHFRHSRRQFLRYASAGASLLIAPAGAALAGAAKLRKLDSIGIQLYTMRDLMARDVPGTLRSLADIGYKSVEFAGYFEHSPADIKMLLEDCGLTAPSAHAPLDALREDPDRVIDTFKTIGHQYLVMAWLAPEERDTLCKYKAHAELFNRVAHKCAAAGLQFAYHNHDFEFEQIDGVLPMDLLLKETDPQLVQVELDLYWITKAGRNPFEYFDRHPGRFPLCHVKDMASNGKMADVGSGQIDFAAIFAASEQAGFRHYFVERDDAQEPLASARNSFSALSSLTW